MQWWMSYDACELRRAFLRRKAFELRRQPVTPLAREVRDDRKCLVCSGHVVVGAVLARDAERLVGVSCCTFDVARSPTPGWRAHVQLVPARRHPSSVSPPQPSAALPRRTGAASAAPHRTCAEFLRSLRRWRPHRAPDRTPSRHRPRRLTSRGSHRHAPTSQRSAPVGPRVGRGSPRTASASRGRARHRALRRAPRPMSRIAVTRHRAVPRACTSG